MGYYNALFTEENETTVLAPANRSANTYDTDWVSMRDVHRLVARLFTGVIASTTTINLKLRQAKDVGGSGAKDIPNKAIVALGGTDDGAIVAIELATAELDVSGHYDCVSARLVIANDDAYTAVVVDRFVPRFAALDSSNYAEVVV